MHIIYVDDEMPAINNFRLTVENFKEIKELHTFQSGEKALEFAKNNTVDAAFLDMEMPGIHGLGLAKALKELDSEIRIVFVTAYGQYALEAFGVDAIGYLLKPYTAGDIRKELAKCRYRHLPSHRLVVQTMPSLSLSVDGAPFAISSGKAREMFALLVDRGEQGVTMGECISCLWPERPSDSSAQSLCRMTWKRLTESFERAGIGELLYTSENRRYLKTEAVECDLYRILSGDKHAARMYNGEYLSEYAWAEDKNAHISRVFAKGEG